MENSLMTMTNRSRKMWDSLLQQYIGVGQYALNGTQRAGHTAPLINRKSITPFTFDFDSSLSDEKFVAIPHLFATAMLMLLTSPSIPPIVEG